ncbi:MAG: aldehyde ferredoxin oxidoreductase family protein [Thermoguttaceae bacterium]|nr:aldehyde ferredoxin oxidoreductase family protein [Thermoguttaceae bacterium]
MAVPGTMGRIAFVDLNTGDIRIEQPSDDVYLQYLGGYGLGAYYLYRLQKPKVDPLGPENHLGFFTGLLTGTPSITGNRYVVVGKSPKTLTWGDANSGGTFGVHMKAAGFDGVVFRGQASRPVYLLLENGTARLLPADDWWGKDCVEIDELVREKYGAEAGSACVGPAGERCQLLAAIINDKGRAAGRSGLGALMGSKRLKAIVAVGDMTPTIADPEGMKRALEEFRRFIRQQDFYKVLSEYGTAGITAGAVATQDCPIKNWAGTPDDFPTAKKISDDSVVAIQRRKYACWRCPIGCGGETEVTDGPFKSKTHKPEYETLGSFGAMLLNDNLASINMCNEICNRYGLDTISTGCTIAFAMECFEKGIITEADTGGLKLTWGNAEAIVELTRQIAEYRGFGQVLADGAKRAAERIGKGAEQYAMHIGGEEVPMHDPRLNPGLATSYKMDATPGRHTQMSAWTVEAEFAPPGLWPEKIERYKYTGKGKAHAVVSNHHHASSAAGMCLFGWSVLPPTALCDCLTYTTGHKFTLDDVLTIGARIAALRIAFNLREGIRNVDLKIPGRIVGDPPLTKGPVAGVTVDVDTQVREYLEAMGWDPVTGIPTPETLRRVGLEWVIPDLHG